MSEQQNYCDKYVPLVPYMPIKAIPGNSYTPYQVKPDYFDIEQGYKNGTIYPDLVRPYKGKLICKKEVY